jgi:hypothetical protein
LEKILLLSLLAVNLLFSANTPNMFHLKIDETLRIFSEPILVITYDSTTQESMVVEKERDGHASWLDVKILDNIENNGSQEIFKEKMEELVKYYLETDMLFSKQSLAYAKIDDLSVLRFDKFFSRLYIYIRYLEKHNNTKENAEMLNMLLTKALSDSMMLMKNSDDFLNYMLSVNMVKKLYGSLSYLENYKTILLKYPLLKSELFFEKLKFDKENTFKLWN